MFGATPGGRIEDHVAIRNYSDQKATFLIRGTDAVNTPQGGFAALPINERSHDLGAWIALPRSDLKVTLPPRTDLIIPFLVEVPANATPGDHVGVITATLVSSVISKSGQRLHLLQTVGTRIFLRVSGPLRPSLTVTGLAVHYQGTLDPIGTGKAKVTYTVSNTGNVALGGLPDGLRIGTVREPVHRRPRPEDAALAAGLLGQGDGRGKGHIPGDPGDRSRVGPAPLHCRFGRAAVGPVPGLAVVLGHTVDIDSNHRGGDPARGRLVVPPAPPPAGGPVTPQRGPQKPGGRDRVGKQESPPDDVPASNGSSDASGGRTRVSCQGPDAGGVGRARKRLDLK